MSVPVIYDMTLFINIFHILLSALHFILNYSLFELYFTQGPIIVNTFAVTLAVKVPHHLARARIDIRHSLTYVGH